MIAPTQLLTVLLASLALAVFVEAPHPQGEESEASIRDDATARDVKPVVGEFETQMGWHTSFESWSGSPAPSGTSVGTFYFGGLSTGVLTPTDPNSTSCASFVLGRAAERDARCTFRDSPRLVAVETPEVEGTFLALAASPLAAFLVAACPNPGTVPAGSVRYFLIGNSSTIFHGTGIARAETISIPVPGRPDLKGTAVCIQVADIVGISELQRIKAYDCTIGS